MIAGLKCWRLTGDHKHLTEVNLQPPRHRIVKNLLELVWVQLGRSRTVMKSPGC